MKAASRFRHPALAAAIAVTLGACQAVPSPEASHPTDGTQARRDAALAEADWARKIDLRIEMLDYGYRPRELRLRVGQPYRLTLVNNGSVNHYFTAPEFFSAIATRKAEVPRQAEFKAPVFTSFEVFSRGGSLDLYFVPIIKGTYRAHCHMKDHLALGIEGTVIIE